MPVPEAGWGWRGLPLLQKMKQNKVVFLFVPVFPGK